MILHVENSKDSTKKMLKIVNKFSKVTRYKINMQILVVFLYTSNKLSEIKKTILFTIASKIFRNKVNCIGERLVHSKW